MKRIILAATASAAALMAGTPATAAIIIGVGVNGGAVTQVASDAASGSANYNTIANGLFFNSSATGFPILAQPSLLTQSVNLQQAGGTSGTLNLYITQTDLPAFNGSLLSSFTSNTISNAGAVLSTYYSTANALFGGTLLQSAAYNAMGTTSGTNLLVTTGLFSTTVRYDITFGTGAGSFNGTANLAATAVPEPASWALMLLGFGGFGYAMRRRTKIATGARIRFA